MKRLLFVILLTIMGCCGVHVQAVGYEKIINPVLPGDRPDPTVIEINGEYWAAATSNEWSPLFLFLNQRFSELGIGELCFSGWST